MNAQSFLIVVLGSSFLGGCLVDKEPATPAAFASSPSTSTSTGEEGDGVTFVEASSVSQNVSPTNAATSVPSMAAQSHYVYDRTGAPAGRGDPNGSFYDATGAPSGRVDPNGSYYDRTGAPAGRADPNGSYYDGTGAPLGRLDPNGQVYDRTGAPAGRIDSNGNFYDASGAPAGRVDGECDDACKRDLAKRILDARDGH